MNTEFTDKEKEEKYLIKEIDIPFLAIWEVLGYLDISIDCFDLAMKNQEKEYDMIIFQIGNYAKERVEKFIGDNTYSHADETAISYKIFNGYVFYDAGIHFRISLDGEMDKHRKREREKIHWDTSSMIIDANFICDGDYLLDERPFIIAKNHKRFLSFFTDREIFKSLYERAKDEIEAQKEEIADYHSFLISKADALNEKLDSFSDQLVASLTNSNLIMWHVLLKRYIREISTLITDKWESNTLTNIVTSPDDSTGNKNRFSSREVIIALKEIFNQFDKGISNGKIVKFGSLISGYSTDTLEKQVKNINSTTKITSDSYAASLENVKAAFLQFIPKTSEIEDPTYRKLRTIIAGIDKKIEKTTQTKR